MDRHKRRRDVRYVDVDDGYLHRRRLRKSADWLLLWGLGVGAVISGDFFGWNYGLAAGGFGGLLIATVIVAVMYLTLVFSIAELSTALPHAGGFYAFTRHAFGPTWAYINGITDLVEYVISPAVIVVGIAGYMDALIPGVPAWIWWALFYVLFVFINIRGTKLSLQVSLIVTFLALGVLVVFYGAAIFSGALSWDNLFNIQPQPGNSGFLPFGLYGVFAALPYAIWFYLAIEQLPVAAEESHDVVRDMPRALILAILTLLALSVLTLVLNVGVAGAKEVGESAAPLELGFKAVFQDAATTTVLTLISITGLVASFHAIIYAYGRVLFALSRAGYLPRGLSVVSRHHTPHYALTLGAVVGFVICILINAFSDSVGAALLNMAVFGAVISYALTLFSYIHLARTRPNLPRPYRSPLGVLGAWVGAILALICLAATFAVESYRPGVVGTVIFVVLMMGYYWFYSRFRLVARAPEEESALIAEAERELR
ncbi:MAG: ethanolamine permease [Gloeomargarita sp. SKYG116]|nr:ethanolamine permease [Gloeomargarita sp. SKYG116]MDW8401179.1 ethanolamine permease [Gloeomargarita sp. SKYGB_i_bin116]